VEEAFDFSATNTVFRTDALWRFTENRRQRLDFTGFSFRRGGNRRIIEVIAIECPASITFFPLGCCLLKKAGSSVNPLIGIRETRRRGGMSDLVHRAMRFAKETHQRIDQRRKYSNQPYAVHLEQVAKITASVTDDKEMIAAAWLHDVVEDTPATLDDIEHEFGFQFQKRRQEGTETVPVAAEQSGAHPGYIHL
jgi:hypothetical protein